MMQSGAALGSYASAALPAMTMSLARRHHRRRRSSARRPCPGGHGLLPTRAAHTRRNGFVPCRNPDSALAQSCVSGRRGGRVTITTGSLVSLRRRCHLRDHNLERLQLQQQRRGRRLPTSNRSTSRERGCSGLNICAPRSRLLTAPLRAAEHDPRPSPRRHDASATAPPRQWRQSRPLASTELPCPWSVLRSRRTSRTSQRCQCRAGHRATCSGPASSGLLDPEDDTVISVDDLEPWPSCCGTGRRRRRPRGAGGSRAHQRSQPAAAASRAHGRCA